MVSLVSELLYLSARGGGKHRIMRQIIFPRALEMGRAGTVLTDGRIISIG